MNAEITTNIINLSWLIYMCFYAAEIINGMIAETINPIPTIKVVTAKKPSSY